MKRLIPFIPGLIAGFAILAMAIHAYGAANSVGNFVIPPDIPARYASNIRPAPSYIDARVLAANTVESHTMPANARFVLFSSTCNFYVNPNGTAAVPAADVTDGTGSELNPAAYYWTTPPTSLSMIAPTACVVTMAIYLGPVR